MYSLGSSGRRVAVSFTVASILTFVAQAFADDKQACSDAYEKTQSLRNGGQLRAAREQALICVREVCPEFIRTDCSTWLTQVEASVPTVVFEVRDADGKDVATGSVSLDGQPWLDVIDLAAHPVDTGTHTFRVESRGSEPAEAKLTLREGDKNKRISVQLKRAATPQPVVPRAPQSSEPPPEQREGGRSIAPWILGGAGAAVLVTGVVLGVVTIAQKSTWEDNCNLKTEECNPDGLDAADTGRTLGPISTVAMVVGGAAIAGAGVWLLVDDGGAKSETATISTGVVGTSDGAAWRVRGSF